MIAHRFPADSELYSAAQDYIGSIAAMGKVGTEFIAKVNQARTDSHAHLEALLVRHNIEFYDKTDVLDIACALATYRIEGGF